jgi:hypothetical protein
MLQHDGRRGFIACGQAGLTIGSESALSPKTRARNAFLETGTAGHSLGGSLNLTIGARSVSQVGEPIALALLEPAIATGRRGRSGLPCSIPSPLRSPLAFSFSRRGSYLTGDRLESANTRKLAVGFILYGDCRLHVQPATLSDSTEARQFLRQDQPIKECFPPRAIDC